MKVLLAALLIAAIPTAASAAGDQAHRRDHERIRQMNRAAAATFARRDRAQGQANHASAARYQAERARYEAAMARWRRQVAARNR